MILVSSYLFVDLIKLGNQYEIVSFQVERLNYKILKKKYKNLYEIYCQLELKEALEK